MISEIDSVNDTVSAYWDARSQGYALQVDKQQETDEFANYRMYFGELAPNSQVLDVGCGPGFFATELAKKGFCVTAVDMSRGMLEQTERRAQARGVVVKTVLADAKHLPFDDESFDLVCCRDLVWNLPDPKSAYREWLRVLKPEAKLVIFDGNYYRYLFDERYAKVHDAWEKSFGHILLGVKTQTIDDVAKTLPLGQEDRPAWDIATFQALGIENVQAHTLSTYETDDGAKPLIAKFVVVVKKGAKASF